VLLRGALAVRRALLGDALRWLEGLPDGVVGFALAGGAAAVTCLLNTRPVPVPVRLPGRLVLASAPLSYDGTVLVLPADACAWVSPA